MSRDEVSYLLETVSRVSLVGLVPSTRPPPGSVATSLRRPAPQENQPRLRAPSDLPPLMVDGTARRQLP